MPEVSIVVRTVNRPEYLKECLQSIAWQDEVPDVEAIIVNDGGPTLKALLETLPFSLSYSLIEFEESVGRSTAGNTGLKKATGNYVGFLDDDDIFYPFHLKTLLSYLQQSKTPVAYTDALRATQSPQKNKPGLYKTDYLTLTYSKDFSFETLVTDNYLPILSVLFRRDCLDVGVEFDSNLEVLEDWDFWIQLGSKFQFHHIPRITAEYRARLDKTNTTGNNEDLWEQSRKYIREKWGQK